MIENNEYMEINYDNLREFINEQIEDNRKKLDQIRELKRGYLNKIVEIEALMLSLKDKNNDNTKLFSPNTKYYNLEEYEKEKIRIQEKVNKCDDEQKKMENNILQLQTILNMLNKKITQIGLNILELQEQDRQRIARDLHDSTVQILTSLIHKCEISTRFVDIDPIRTKLELTTISNTLKSVINEIREVIFNLKPMSLEDLGLIMAIERFINQLMNHNDIEIKFRHNEERKDVLPVINLSLFRVIQEACNNAIKHSNAKCIEIDINYDVEDIKVTIKDNGKGFDTSKIKDRNTQDYSGCGLSIMKERIYLLSGKLDIKSTINKGTIVNISVPYCNVKGKKNEQTD